MKNEKLRRVKLGKSNEIITNRIGHDATQEPLKTTKYLRNNKLYVTAIRSTC